MQQKNAMILVNRLVSWADQDSALLHGELFDTNHTPNLSWCEVGKSRPTGFTFTCEIVIDIFMVCAQMFRKNVTDILEMSAPFGKTPKKYPGECGIDIVWNWPLNCMHYIILVWCVRHLFSILLSIFVDFNPKLGCRRSVSVPQLFVVCTPDVLGYIMLHPFLWSLKNITGLVASTPSLGPHLVVADWYWFREFRISLPYSESCWTQCMPQRKVVSKTRKRKY